MTVMATYGKYEVVRNPNGYVVVDMQTHEWVTKETSDREKAHRQARQLQKRGAKNRRR